VVTDGDRRYAFAYFLDYGTTFMSEDRRENSFRILAGQRKRVRMADAGSDVSQQDLSGFRPIEFDFLDFEGLASFPGNGCTCLHVVIAPLLEYGPRIFARLPRP
jgi:hypothetical protein